MFAGVKHASLSYQSSNDGVENALAYRGEAATNGARKLCSVGTCSGSRHGAVTFGVTTFGLTTLSVATQKWDPSTNGTQH